MLHQVVLFLSTSILLITTKSLGIAEDLTDSGSNCLLIGIHSDLETAIQVIQTARRKLPNYLNEVCEKDCSNRKPSDCSDIYKGGRIKDGVYEIWPRSRVTKGSILVYCHMTGDGGGWTVIQRRGEFGSDKEYFYQDWSAYKKGFGNILKDFWIGNDNLFALTNQRAYELRFDFTDFENNSSFAAYDEFWVDDEPHDYTLHVKGFRGTAGDSFSRHSGAKFSTNDKDNDGYDTGSCAVSHKGAWWYTNCHVSNLNGIYYQGKHDSYADGVNWANFKGYHYSLKDAVMKIRPTDFETNLNLRKTTA